MLTLAACTAPPAEGPPSPEGVRAVAVPHQCLAKRRLFEALGHDVADEPAAGTEPAPARRMNAPPIEDAYAAAAPATVLIRTSNGLGSGVIVDASGLVLTNHHVVDEFLQPDLTVKVTLELPEVDDAGQLVPTGEPLDGVVVKADAVKDLALVKISHPPKNLPVAALSEHDPAVGELVLSVGNAGIGLLWAAKVCNISRMGDLTRETSMLQMGDCNLLDPSDTPDESRRKREQCEAQKKQIKEHAEQAPQALAIQTTCSLNGGDSGGPLVNAWGEIIGLNQSLRFAGGTLAFHVHAAEIRAFMQDARRLAAGDGGQPIVPDPFCEGGVEFKVEDSDGDGVVDSAMAAGFPFFDAGEARLQGSYLIDLDQKHPKQPSVAAPFDAEVAILLKEHDGYVFFDTDDDGVFDVLLRDKQADGSVELGYRLKGGAVERDASLTGKPTLEVVPLAAEARARLGSAALFMGLTRIASRSLLDAGGVPPVPNIARVFGKKGRAVDFDSDGKVDGIMADAAPGFGGTMLATHWDALAQLKDADDASVLLEKGDLRPDFVRLEGPAGTWTLYDTDGSGSMDVALFAKQPPVDNERDRWMTQHENVTHAFRLTAQGTVPWRDPLGRGLVIPELVPESLRDQLDRFSGGSRRGGFPNVFNGAPGMGGTWKLEALEHDRQVLTHQNRFGEVVIIDLDRDTKKLATSTPEDLARDDKFDAEMAIYRQGNLCWVFYDEKNNGVFDHVIFSRDVHSAVADNELTISPTGEKVDSVAPSGPLLRPELVARSPQLQERLRSLFRQMQLRALAEPAG